MSQYQVTCLDKQVYDLNQLCMTGEHWMAFEYPWQAGLRSCACGRLSRHKPVGFILQERPLFQVPMTAKGTPCRFGVEFHPKALERMVAVSG